MGRKYNNGKEIEDEGKSVMEKEVIFSPFSQEAGENRETNLRGRCRRDEVCQERVQREREERK